MSGRKILVIGDGRSEHAYLRKLREMAEAGLLDGLGRGDHRLVVRHDGGCGIWHGRVCDCNPDFEVERDAALVQFFGKQAPPSDRRRVGPFGVMVPALTWGSS